MDLRAAAIVGIGSFFGGSFRYALATFIDAKSRGDFPLSILLINVSGSFFIGFLAPLMTYYGWDKNTSVPLFLSVGMLGGFTTFSTFSLQTLRLAQSGNWGLAFANAAASVFCCLVSVFLGLKMGRLLWA